MDGIQKLLVVVIVVLTTLLFVVGVQVILIILDLRRALRRLNSILEDAVLGGGLIRPDKITGILELFKKNKKMNKIGQGELHEPKNSN
jgi:hypothetical protein